MKFILVLMLLFSGNLFADDMSFLVNTSAKDRADSQTHFMQNKLNLNEDEVLKVRAINLEFAEKADPIIKGSENAFFKMKDMKNIQSDKDEALEKVLTQDQFKLYSQSKDELKSQMEKDLKH
jgi:hypothetical protein